MLSLNVQGLSDKIKRTKVFRMLREKKVDIACLQETHCTKQKQKWWKNEWRHQIYFSNGESNARGVMILLSNKFAESEVLDVKSDHEGRMVSVQILIATQKVRIVNLYAPNEDSPEFFAANLTTYNGGEGDDLTYVMGDLNVTLDQKLDKRGGNTSKSKARDVINTFLEEEDWLDVWRALHEETFQFTWKRRTPLIMTRLDYMLAPLGSFTKVIQCKISPAVISDHCPVECSINLTPAFRGPGYWKFNVSHLQDPNFVMEMNQEIELIKSRTKNCNPINRWGIFKNNVREVAITLSRKQTSLKMKEKIDLNKRLMGLNKKLTMINLSSDRAVHWIQETNNKIDEIKSKLTKIGLHDAQGAMLRAKVRWTSQGEHNTAYFYGLEKRNATNKIMNAVYDENNEIETKSESILKIQANFYNKLYTKNENFTCKLEGQSPKKVPEQMKVAMDVEISVDEIQNAIKDMKRKKAPGADGLQIDFYIVFWNRIKDIFCDMISQVMKENKLHESSRYGLISLIPKKDRDLKFVKSWRPIVLLDADFKVLSKVLANRVKTTLNEIIHNDQTGFVKSRLITENLRKFLDVIEYAEVNNVPGVLVSIDFEKAFDKIEYEAVYAAMRWFNFGENLISMIKVLFNEFYLSTTNNGYCSQPFLASKGLFQGNPIAPYLFIIVMELLAIKIRNNPKIKGLKIKEHEILMSLFADDLGLILDHDQRSWDEVVHTFNWFEKNTGMVINYEKTVIYRLGSIRNTQAKFYSQRQLMWSDEPLKVLGITLTGNEKDLISLNYDNVMEKVEALTSIWMQRGLSLFGKILIVNTLIASQFNYKFAVLPKLPENYVKRFNNIITKFIWNNKTPKISKTILTGLKTDGGAGLVDIEQRESALKMKWVTLLSKTPDLCELVYKLMENPIGDLIWKVNLLGKDRKNLCKKTNFWKGILHDWLTLANKQPTCKKEVQEQILWFNSKIKIDNKVIFNEVLYKAGINQIKDLISENGDFLPQSELEKKTQKQVAFTIILGIREAIDPEWKVMLKQKNSEKGKQHLYDKLGETKQSVSKTLYRLLKENENLLNQKCEKMNAECDTLYDSKEMADMVRKINAITISVKLRSFQYRFLMNAVLTNTHLFKYKIVQNDRCSFCNIDRETRKHLFFDCPYVRYLWKDIEDKYNCKLNFEKIVTNIVNLNPKHPLNTVILMVKYYIYSVKCQQQRLSVQSCENFIKEYISIEEIIAKDKDKLALHNNKWSEYL